MRYVRHCYPGEVFSDWLLVAKRYAGNSTVIGFDLDNEPLMIPGASVIGGDGPTDIHAMWTNTGNAILAINPGALIIVEGPIRWDSEMIGFDLSWVTSNPVVLNVPKKVVYSVHEYPRTIGAQPVDSGPEMIRQMNAAWGYLVTQNIAPVWIGEIGASLDGVSESAGSGLVDEQAWAATVSAYLNGQYGGQGGPTFSGKQQAISTRLVGVGKS